MGAGGGEVIDVCANTCNYISQGGKFFKGGKYPLPPPNPLLSAEHLSLRLHGCGLWVSQMP